MSDLTQKLTANERRPIGPGTVIKPLVYLGDQLRTGETLASVLSITDPDDLTSSGPAVESGEVEIRPLNGAAFNAIANTVISFTLTAAATLSADTYSVAIRYQTSTGRQDIAWVVFYRQESSGE